VDGDCEVACTDACSEGSVKCNADGTATQDCELDSGTGCWVWGAEVDCGTGETCSGGQCSASCVDECTTGSRQCDGDGYQICGDFDSDACTDWGPVTDCALGETCSDGFCSTSCTNECSQGAVQCSGATGTQSCGDFDSDNCLEWGPVSPCATGETCSNGVCATSCTDECSQTGDAQCTPSGGGFQECGDFDADNCLEWSTVTTCDSAAGETCVSGACVVACDCDFNAGICEPEAPGSTTACGCDPDCGTPCGQDGHCDSWCPAGQDPDCACACDYNEYCEADAQGSSATCPCDPDCELHEVACSDDGHCDTFCPDPPAADADPDCGGVDPCRDRWITVGWRYADELWLTGNYESPDSVEGAPWVLLSPDLSSGEAEIWVEFAEERSLCVDQIAFDAWGYDDSLFGDGAEVYLYNWTTFQWDLLAENFAGGSADWVFNTVATNVQDYLLCGSGAEAKCYINGKIGASAWDNTHFQDVWVDVHLTP
jgi:hypothetical protein